MVKGQFGLDYVKDNNFAEVKYMEILTARKDQVNKIAGLQNNEGQPYFSLRYVLDKYLGMTDDDKVANQRAKEATAKRKEEKEKEEASKTEEPEGTTETGSAEGGEEEKSSFTL
jgi:hypothetical protein